MSLYLVQHGKAYSKDEDPERGLTPEGEEEVKRMAALAAERGLNVAKILRSGKKRAKQTADIFAAALSPGKGVLEISGVNPTDDVDPFAQTLNANENLMVVGHLPFMEKLTALLLTGNSEKTIVKFQNAGIVRLDESEDGGWMLTLEVTPNW